jgi:hypothetical protein
MTNIKTVNYLFDYYDYLARADLEKIGELVARMYTDHGLPFESVYETKLKDKYKKEEVVSILFHYQAAITRHSLESGITDKRLAEKQKRNQKDLCYFIEKGDFLYA